MKSSTTTSQAGRSPNPQRTGRRLTVLIAIAVVVLVVAGFAAFHRPDPPAPPVHDDPKPEREVAHQPAPSSQPALPQPASPQPALPQESPAEPLPTSSRPANAGAPGMARKLAQITRTKVQKYVHEAYPAWLKAHPGQTCPHELSELNELAGETDAKDGWGRPLKMYCGAVLGSSGKRIEVISYGRDAERGTEDDIRAEE